MQHIRMTALKPNLGKLICQYWIESSPWPWPHLMQSRSFEVILCRLQSLGKHIVEYIFFGYKLPSCWRSDLSNLHRFAWVLAPQNLLSGPNQSARQLFSSISYIDWKQIRKACLILLQELKGEISGGTTWEERLGEAKALLGLPRLFAISCFSRWSHQDFVVCIKCRFYTNVTVNASGKSGSNSSGSYDYDLLIIGAGVGGHGAAIHAVHKVRY